MVKVKIDINKLNGDHADYSQTLFELCTMAVVSGATVEYEDGYATYLIADNNFPMALAQGVVALGGIVTQFEFFIKVSAPDANVPVGVPGREYTDDNGNEAVRTWNEWKLSGTHDFHTLDDDNQYVGGNAHAGEYVMFNEFATVFSDCIDTMTFTSMLPGD